MAQKNKPKVWMPGGKGRPGSKPGVKSAKNRRRSEGGMFGFFAGAKTNIRLKQLTSKIEKKSGDYRYTHSSEKPESNFRAKMYVPSREQLEKINLGGEQKKTRARVMPLGGIKLAWLNFANLFNFRFALGKTLGGLTFILTLLTFIFGFLYLAAFDTYFLVKDYDVELPEGSYLSPTEVEKLSDYFNQQKLLGFIPMNGYWFINTPSLTVAAREMYPEIKEG